MSQKNSYSASSNLKLYILLIDDVDSICISIFFKILIVSKLEPLKFKGLNIKIADNNILHNFLKFY